MTILLTGYKLIDYTNKDGRHITGAEVYGVVQDESDKVVGKETFRQYIPDLKISDLVPEEYYSVEFDIEIFNGKPQARVVGLTMVEV